LRYPGYRAKLIATDLPHRTGTFSATANIPSLIGSSTAHAGFFSGSGGLGGAACRSGIEIERRGSGIDDMAQVRQPEKRHIRSKW
jgi:hypothetical protein